MSDTAPTSPEAAAPQTPPAPPPTPAASSRPKPEAWQRQEFLEWVDTCIEGSAKPTGAGSADIVEDLRGISGSMKTCQQELQQAQQTASGKQAQLVDLNGRVGALCKVLYRLEEAAKSA